MSLGAQGSSGSNQQSSQQGFRDLPPEIQNAFKDLATQAQGFLPGNNAGTTSAFTPLAQTAGETQAINNINRGFTPNAQQFQSDIDMQQNPYNKYVIDEINRQAGGQKSVLNQSLNSAGQFGSNRQFLGANDIDLSRMNNIGSFLQQGYQNASNNALTTLPGLRANDASAQLQAGGFQRGLAGQSAQAPISGLAAISQILGVLPTNSGQSSGSGETSSFGFNGSFGFSDMRVKENIKPHGAENGWPVYEFSYLNDPRRYIGVMAQEVEQIMPEAVVEIEGIKAVNYGRIGVKFREVNGQ